LIITVTKVKLNEFFRDCGKKTDNATIKDEKLALDALDIRIAASTQSIDIKGIFPEEFKPLPLQPMLLPLHKHGVSVFSS